MTNEKRVALFIVEGVSDKIFFSEFEKIFTNHHVLVHVVKGDVFANRDLKNHSIKVVVKDIIRKVLADNSILGLVPSDIEYIFHITDTDCCFQDEEFNNQSLAVIRQIKANKINDVLAMQRYSRDRQYEKYKLLYFAPNLEGALTPSFDLKGKNGSHKVMNMLKFIDSIRNHQAGIDYALSNILNDNKLAPFKVYDESWDYIIRGNNSQGNYTNLKFVLDHN